MKKHAYSLAALLVALFSSHIAKAVNTTPVFSGGHSRSLSSCQNALATSANSILTVTDPDIGQTETWSLVSGPNHGTAAMAYSTIGMGGSITPSGLTYTPATGYSGADTFKVRITDGFASDTTTVYVTVNPLPVVNPVTGLSSVCSGVTITLSASTSGGGWTVSNTNASVAGGIVTGLVAGIDTVMYSVTNFCGTTTVSHTVTINPSPIAGTITGLSSVCVGAVIGLSDAASGGTWFASNTHASVSGGTVSGLVAGVDTITYSVTTVCGTANATHVVTINPLPDADVITGSSTVCELASVSLSDIVPGGSWSASNGNASVSGGLVTGIVAGIDTIMYTVTNVCGSATATFTITVDPLPVAGTLSSMGALAFCPGGTDTLVASVSGGVWSASNGNASVDMFGVATGVVGGLDTIMYSVTNMCGTDIATITVTVNPAPYAGVITGPSSVCHSHTATLSDLSPGGIWSSSNPSAVTITSGGVISGGALGTATISYTVTNSCGTDMATKDVSVDFVALPILDTGTTVCPLSALALLELSQGGTWSSSNPLTAFVTGITGGVGLVFGLIPGTATITYSLNNTCGTSSATTVVTVLSAEECGLIPLKNVTLATVAPGLKIFPDPSNGTFTLDLNTGSGDIANVTITDMLGSVVRSFVVTSGQPVEVALDVPSGIYHVTAVTATGRYSEKVVISR